MRIIIKILGAAALAAVILFPMTTCADTTEDTTGNGPTHYEGALEISGQVWLQNKEAKRQSDEWYFKFNGDSDINVFAVFSCSEGNITSSASLLAGSGKIDKGILSFNVPEPDTENLVDMGIIFANALFKEYTDVKIEPSDTVMGNIIIPVTSDNARLNREGLFLMYSSVGMESIQFVYVDNNCTVTGNPDIITWNLGPQSYVSRTDNAIELSLQKGWNTIYRMEVYDRSSGYDNVSMGIDNPNNFKWVLYQ
jgi:hypothetical protein